MSEPRNSNLCATVLTFILGCSQGRQTFTVTAGNPPAPSLLAPNVPSTRYLRPYRLCDLRLSSIWPRKHTFTMAETLLRHAPSHGRSLAFHHTLTAFSPTETLLSPGRHRLRLVAPPPGCRGTLPETCLFAHEPVSALLTLPVESQSTSTLTEYHGPSAFWRKSYLPAGSSYLKDRGEEPKASAAGSRTRVLGQGQKDSPTRARPLPP